MLAVVTVATVVGFTALSAVMAWTSVLLRLRWTEAAARPFTTIGLMGTGLAFGAMDTPAGQLVVLGLACSLVADVFLVLDVPRSFLGALSGTVVAYLVYTASFVVLGLESRSLLVRAGAVLGGALLLTPRIPLGILRLRGPGMLVPALLYLGVAGLLVGSAALTGNEAVFAGTGALVVGDIFLARSVFVRPRRMTATFAVVVHHVGLALVLGGVLLFS